MFSLPWLRLWLFVALFALLSLGIPWLLARELDLGGLTWPHAWSQPSFLLSCLLMLLFYFLLDAARLYFTLRALGSRVKALQLLPLVFLNFLVSGITPLATGGGVAQVWYLQRQGVRIGVATAATTLRSVQAMLVIFIAAPIIFARADWITLNDVGRSLLVAVAGVTLAYAALMLIAVWRGRWIAQLLDSGWQGLALITPGSSERWHRARYHTRRETLRFSRSVRQCLAGHPLMIALAIFSSVFFLVVLFAFPAVLFHGLGYSISLSAVMERITIVTYLLYFAPTPGGAGVAEGLFGWLFSGMIEAHDLLLGLVAWRFLTVQLGMLLGIPVVLWLVRRWRLHRWGAQRWGAQRSRAQR